MDQLPNDMINILFTLLFFTSIPDLLTMRRLSRGWKTKVDNFDWIQVCSRTGWELEYLYNYFTKYRQERMAFQLIPYVIDADITNHCFQAAETGCFQILNHLLQQMVDNQLRKLVTKMIQSCNNEKGFFAMNYAKCLWRIFLKMDFTFRKIDNYTYICYRFGNGQIHEIQSSLFADGVLYMLEKIIDKSIYYKDIKRVQEFQKCFNMIHYINYPEKADTIQRLVNKAYQNDADEIAEILAPSDYKKK